MNLENLGLVELNAQEMKETEGGWIFEFFLGLVVGAIIYFLEK